MKLRRMQEAGAPLEASSQQRKVRRGFRGLGAVSVLAAVIALAAACGSSGTSATSDAHGNSDVIRLMQIGVKANPAFSQPEQFIAAKARVDAINASGGIKGKKIELTQCDSNLDPNQEAACVDKAVKGKYSAVVASTLVFTPMATLDKAGIPFAGSSGITLDQFTNSDSFPFAGNVASFYGEASIALAQGVKTLSVVGPSDASNKFNVEMLQDAVKLSGIKLKRTATAPLGKPDYSAAAGAAIQGNPDAVALCGPKELITKVIVSMKQQGYKGHVITYGDGIDQASIKAMGSAADGTRIAMYSLPPTVSNDETKLFVSEMKKADPKAKLNQLSGYGWSSIFVFDKIMENASSFDAAGVAAAYAAATKPVDSGLMGPFVGAGTSPIGNLPRAFNRQFVAGVITDGKIVSDGVFKDAYEDVKSHAIR